MSSQQPSRQPKGIPTGGQFAASAHAEAGVSLSDLPGLPEAMEDEAGADAQMAWMEAQVPHDLDATAGDCARCGSAMVEDPAGSSGVLVHADEHGQPDYDRDEDHAPVPQDAVPDLGLTGLMDAENARNGAWEPGQVGGFDPESGRCLDCDGHYSHAPDCATLRADADADAGAAAVGEANRLLAEVDMPMDVETGYEMNRAHAGVALDAFDRGEGDGLELAMTSIAMESTLTTAATEREDEDLAAAAFALAEAREQAEASEFAATDVETLAARLRDGITAGEKGVRSYDGRTAKQWRAEAAACYQRSADSFARSDTDGYLSQWASDTTGRKYHACADLAEQAGRAEFPALVDLDGNLVPAKIIDTKYGRSWMFLDENGHATGEFLSTSKARKAERRNAFYEGKGFRTATVRVPATVRLSDGMMPSPYFARTDGGFDVDAEITGIGETHDWD